MGLHRNSIPFMAFSSILSLKNKLKFQQEKFRKKKKTFGCAKFDNKVKICSRTGGKQLEFICFFLMNGNVKDERRMSKY